MIKKTKHSPGLYNVKRYHRPWLFASKHEALLGGVYAPCSVRHFTPFSLLGQYRTPGSPRCKHYHCKASRSKVKKQRNKFSRRLKGMLCTGLIHVQLIPLHTRGECELLYLACRCPWNISIYCSDLYPGKLLDPPKWKRFCHTMTWLIQAIWPRWEHCKWISW